MTEQATRPHPGLRTMTLQSPQFTIAGTLPELYQLFPDAELSLLIGSDVVRALSYRWEGLEQLAGSRFIIGMRHGDEKEEIESITRPINSRYKIEFVFIPAQKTTGHASSSTARNGDIRHLPVEITHYIRRNNLYS
jgi:nicotinic acid mononucleotide adenylyltransferase